MSITIQQIQSLLNTYHRQQVQSRLSEARLRYAGGVPQRAEDEVLISAEAKRLQIYQKTAEEVVRRMWRSQQEEAAAEGMTRGEQGPVPATDPTVEA
jgi:hypothetical protein